MTQRWGKDQEERQACTQKAQDAYAAARQALARIDGLEARVDALLRRVDDMESMSHAMMLKISTLERKYLQATEPIARATGKRVLSRRTMETAHA